VLVDHRVIDGAEHDGEVKNPVDHPCDVISRGPAFFVSFSVDLPKIGSKRWHSLSQIDVINTLSIN